MNKYLYAAFAFLAAVSCTREAIIPEEPTEPAQEQRGPIEVSLVAGNPATRTEVFNDGSLKPYWSIGDNISVVFIDGDDYEMDPNHQDFYWFHPFSSGLTQRDLSARFTGSVAQSGQYRAFYPANSWLLDEDDDEYLDAPSFLDWEYSNDLGYSQPSLHFTIPSIQNPTSTSFDPKADLLVSAPFEIDDSGDLTLGAQIPDIPISFTRPNAILKVKFNPSGELRDMLDGQKVRKVCFNTMDDIQEGGGEYVDYAAPASRAILVDNQEQNLCLTGEATYLFPYISGLSNYKD